MKCDHTISVDGIEYSLCDVGIACPYCRIAELEREIEDKSAILDQVLERLRPLMPIVAALLPGRGDD